MGMMKNTAWLIRQQMLSLCGGGIVLGALFFAASLTPTLIPRNYLTQGVLAGTCFAIGYAAGIFWRWLWHYLELPEPSERLRSTTNAFVADPLVQVVQNTSMLVTVTVDSTPNASSH